MFWAQEESSKSVHDLNFKLGIQLKYIFEQLPKRNVNFLILYVDVYYFKIIKKVINIFKENTYRKVLHHKIAKLFLSLLSNCDS